MRLPAKRLRELFPRMSEDTVRRSALETAINGETYDEAKVRKSHAVGSPAIKAGKRSSHLEEKFLRIWNELGGPPLEREYKFSKERRWRFDFAYINKYHIGRNVAIECEGGIYRPTKSRHTTFTGYSADAIKYAEATFLSWTVFRLTPQMINSETIQRLIGFIKNLEK
jgi:hypothetical protein